ncbi:MAG: nucleoside deaminase [Bacillus sp. (in: Bacteria)]|nr:nucleoside deaminase [Bacillus sp. (in: firmicutes)]MCM1427261.1 nucleoside deaminase [Eubacterium sp.]
MTVNEKMTLVINLAEKALEKNELPIACIIFHNDTIIAQSHASEIEDKRLLVHAELKALMELDKKKISVKEKRQMELFTNLEPCMMCLGAAISTFVGKVYYSLDAHSDGAAKWAKETWDAHHIQSSFSLPAITSGIMEAESRELFRKYIDIHKEGPMVEWVKTIID